MAERRDYERSDISVRGTLLALAIGSAVLAIISGILWLMTLGFAERTEWPASVSVPELGPGPVQPPLQENPQVDLRRLEAQARARLDGTGWVDREHGLAHIPIERAMDMLTERGWPEGAP